jgi:hypothetical protein
MDQLTKSDRTAIYRAIHGPPDPQRVRVVVDALRRSFPGHPDLPTDADFARCGDLALKLLVHEQLNWHLWGPDVMPSLARTYARCWIRRRLRPIQRPITGSGTW